MPVEYSGITDEHLAVRTRAGLFDVSHMGQIELAGADALGDRAVDDEQRRVAAGRSARFSTRRSRPPDGTFVDDVLVYRMADDHYLLVVNAGNIVKDYEWIAGAGEGARRRRRGRQLPARGTRCSRCRGREARGDSADADRRSIWRRSSTTGSPPAKSRASARRCRAPATPAKTASRSSSPPAQAERVWDAMLAGRRRRVDVRPCGLGARDTLRLEACMRLCGSDMDEETTVLEAGLGWIVGWKKDDFLGADAAARAEGRRRSTRKLVAVRDAATARSRGTAIRSCTTAQPVGVVTSGTQTPFLKKAIGFAMVPVELTAVGTPLEHRHSRPRGHGRGRAGAVLQAAQAVRPPARDAGRGGARMYPTDLKYTKDHEWVRVDGGEAAGRHHRLRAAAARRRRVRRAAGSRAAS